jgi:hypothetical protein
MKRILGVLEYGDRTGYPFANCFDGIKHIKETKDFNPKELSAVVFWGGTDISPAFYDETPNSFNEVTTVIPSKRDQFEWTLMKLCEADGVPMIGVCRGAQLMCAYAGGSIAQDVANHGSGHDIVTVDGEVMHASADHHQMMLLKGTRQRAANKHWKLPRYEILAWCEPRQDYYLGENDTITYFNKDHVDPEVVWFPDIKGLAIQPHPEWMGDSDPFVQWCRKLTIKYTN